MYQSVIKDPGGGSLIRIIPDNTNGYRAITNGSLLIVPPGTKAFVAINGIISPPYPPGRYELFTGTDPFFVRMRNVMTRGDPGTSLSVFYVSEHKYSMITGGTGETPFHEKRFDITLRFMAAYNLTYCINDAESFLSRLVGTYSATFSEYEMEEFIRQTVLMPLRDTLSNSLSERRNTEFNSHLESISESTSPKIRRVLSEYGLGIRSFNITCINLPDTDHARLIQLENDFAAQKIRTDIEKDNLDRIWNGNTNNRTIAETLTGITSSGRTAPAINNGCSSARDNVSSDMMRFMLMMQFMPQARDMMNSVFYPQSSSSAPSSDAPPPLPDISCPGCHRRVPRSTKFCLECGHRFI